MSFVVRHTKTGAKMNRIPNSNPQRAWGEYFAKPGKSFILKIFNYRKSPFVRIF